VSLASAAARRLEVLHLFSAHFALEQPRPLPPKVKLVGPIMVRDAEPLPPHLQVCFRARGLVRVLHCPGPRIFLRQVRNLTIKRSGLGYQGLGPFVCYIFNCIMQCDGGCQRVFTLADACCHFVCNPRNCPITMSCPDLQHCFMLDGAWFEAPE
jgi:hypothetical protein